MRNILSVFAIMVTVLVSSCSKGGGNLILTVNDISDKKIALEKDVMCEKDMSVRFPDARHTVFPSTSEMLLALSIGKFDAAVVSEDLATDIIRQTDDFVLLEENSFAEDSIRVILHKSRIPVRSIKSAYSEGYADKTISRVKDSLISDNYPKLILNGILITIGIFAGAWILAMGIAVVMTLLKSVRMMKYIWKPMMMFIKAIHDVPSVVLIFFFYYIIFARLDSNGIFACIVALGVYGSGSFANIICSHLGMIDPLQHKAAHMLGLKGWKKYRLVILPQAVKSMLPFILSESKVLLRATTFAGYVSILDIVKVSEVIRCQTYDTLVPLIFVSIIFLSLSWLIKKGLDLLYNKLFANDRN